MLNFKCEPPSNLNNQTTVTTVTTVLQDWSTRTLATKNLHRALGEKQKHPKPSKNHSRNESESLKNPTSSKHPACLQQPEQKLRILLAKSSLNYPQGGWPKDLTTGARGASNPAWLVLHLRISGCLKQLIF